MIHVYIDIIGFTCLDCAFQGYYGLVSTVVLVERQASDGFIQEPKSGEQGLMRAFGEQLKKGRRSSHGAHRYLRN